MAHVIATQEAQDTTGKLQAILDQTVKVLFSFNIVGNRTQCSTIPRCP
jgi:hypothetical protein